MNSNLIARWFALCVGILDLSSGLGLVVLPSLTLRTMLIAVPEPAALVFVRFVGVFVAAMGASYLWAWLVPARRLRIVLGGTIFFRAGVGLFTGITVFAGALDKGWLVVTAADIALVVLQSWLLARGAGPEA